MTPNLSSSRSVASQPGGIDHAVLAGRLLRAARAAWLLVAGLAVGLTLASIPADFARLTTVCAGASCPDPHLTPEMVASLGGIGLSPEAVGGYLLAVELIAVGVFTLISAIIVRGRPREPMALLAALLLVTFGASIGPMTSLTAVEPLLLVVGFLASASLFSFAYSFPQGRFVPAWTGWLALLVVAWQVPDTFFRSWSISTYNWPATANAVVWLFLAVSIVVVQLYRYRRVSTAEQRMQTRWVVAGLALSALSFAAVVGFITLVGQQPDSVAALAFGGTAYYLALLPLPLSIGVAMARDGLWGIDVLIGRGVVYLGLTAAVVAIYALIVVGMGQLLRVDNLLLSLLATGVIAVVFQPMRLRLQRLVARLLYGERDDPYLVLSGLGRRLGESIDPDAVLPTVVSTVAATLRLPYVAITVRRGDADEVVAAFGERFGEPLRLPLRHRGVDVGELVVGHRAGERSFSSAELVLLEDLARQAGAAAQAVQLTTELRRSREEIVLAREEERRRLRRDLHDGLGPSLASVALMADAARNVLATDPGRADALLAELKAEARSATAEVRRVVHELRPPALDELGLVGALREQAAQYTAAGLEVEVVAADLGDLPAAVEVAAYRIVSEALTNVVRHADARRAVLSLWRAQGLELTVRDDGRGLGSTPAGVGVSSMRQRAEELGGGCAVTGSEGGTEVRASLPLGGAS
jgi:signal transduction histidine kinase